MKKLYTLIFFFFFTALSSNSQIVDLGITAIVDPVPGASIPNNYNDTIKFSMVNNGATIAANDTVPIGLGIDGIPVLNLFAFMQSDFPAGVTGVVSFYGIDMGVLGLSNGNHTFCFWTQMPGDVDNSNDTACATYTLVDPAPTGFDVFGLKEYTKLYFKDGRLQVDISNQKIVNGVELTVCDLMGRTVYSDFLSGLNQVSAEIQFDTYSNGIYLVRVRSNTGWMETRKLYLE